MPQCVYNVKGIVRRAGVSATRTFSAARSFSEPPLPPPQPVSTPTASARATAVRLHILVMALRRRAHISGSDRATPARMVSMAEIVYVIVEVRARLGAVASEVSATREPVAITDHGNTIAVLVSPADVLELEEMRALAAYRERQARGESSGVPHGEAFRRVFGEEAA
jgi:prevent-host-death family protein